MKIDPIEFVIISIALVLLILCLLKFDLGSLEGLLLLRANGC